MIIFYLYGNWLWSYSRLTEKCKGFSRAWIQLKFVQILWSALILRKSLFFMDHCDSFNIVPILWVSIWVSVSDPCCCIVIFLSIDFKIAMDFHWVNLFFSVPALMLALLLKNLSLKFSKHWITGSHKWNIFIFFEMIFKIGAKFWWDIVESSLIGF